MKVTRTIITTIITPAKITVDNGKINTEEMPAFKLVGTVEASLKEVSNYLLKKYPNEKMVELSRETKEETYGMDLEKFIELSEVVVRPPSQTKKKGGNK